LTEDGPATERPQTSGFDLCRREFLVGAASAVAVSDFLTPVQANPLSAADSFLPQALCSSSEPALTETAVVSSQGAPDYRLTIEPVSVEIAPGHVIKTTGYNGGASGPLIRVPENQMVSIAVDNKTSRPDIVHWHGLQIPSVQDGSMEEGSPMIEPGGSFVYSFAAKPSGTRWYHSHAMAGPDLTKALYTAEYGFFYIEPKNDPGHYDQEIFLVLHHWDPAWVNLQDLFKGPPPNNGLEIIYKSASINGKALGHGEPIRVRFGQRVLFRLLNSSATQDVMLAMPGHRFTVLAMDGNPAPNPQTVDWIMLSPAERIDAVVEMRFPGVWVLGSLSDSERASGMGIVVEYAGSGGSPIWLPHAMPRFWDYTMFAHGDAAPEPDERIELVFQKILGGRGNHNYWTINGKSWPHTDPIMVEAGKRYRISMHNLSFDMHPIHTHRHSFEVTNYMGKQTSGLIKDVVALPGGRSGEIDLIANNPGPSLFHCHMQDHQDFGFMALIKYA
jgi:FtsP/CotA-like multicopper oxidase with cupredoxin domain